MKKIIGINGINNWAGGTEVGLVELCNFLRNHYDVWITQKDGEVSALDPLLEMYSIKKITKIEASHMAKYTDILVMHDNLAQVQDWKKIKKRIGMIGGSGSKKMLQEYDCTHFWTRSQFLHDLIIQSERKIPVFVSQTPIDLDYWKKNNDLSILAKFRTENKISNHIIFGTVSRNVKTKRIDLISNYIKDIPNKKLLIIGIMKEKAPDHIYASGLSHDYYKFMDIFIFTSETEGLPRVLMEAMSMELPIVSCNIGGITSLGCKFCIPNTKSEFSKIINYLIKSPALREEIGKLNRKRIEEFNTSTKERILTFLEEL